MPRSLRLFSFPKIYAFVIFFVFAVGPALSFKAKPILRLQRFCKKIERCVNLIGEICVCRPKLYVMRSMSFFFFYPRLSPFLRTPLTRHPAPFFLAYLFSGSFQCISGSYSFYIASLSVPYRISGILLFLVLADYFTRFILLCAGL